MEKCSSKTCITYKNYTTKLRILQKICPNKARMATEFSSIEIGFPIENCVAEIDFG